jgi:hypothetical protein
MGTTRAAAHVRAATAARPLPSAAGVGMDAVAMDAEAPQAHAPADGAGAAAAAAPAAALPSSAGVSDEALAARVRAVLSVADLETTTERGVRKQLEGELGVSLAERKAFIRAQARGAAAKRERARGYALRSPRCFAAR